MEELKTSLQNELIHVKEVWFDQHDNWYLHNVATAVRSMTREEILGSASESGEPSEQTGKKKRK